MQHVLCLWDPSRHSPLPTSRDEAIEMAERLLAITDSANTRFIEFAELLVQRYEEDTAVKEQFTDIHAFWGSDPAQDAAICTSAVLRLSIPDDEGIRQISHAVQAAAEIGLVTFDDETGMCFLPDGTILPEEDREMWEFNLAEMKGEPSAPNAENSDGRSFMEKLGGELFNAIGQGNNHQS